MACGGRSPLDSDIAAYDAPGAPGLTPGSGHDDGGEPIVDAGARPGKDAGKDAGQDAGIPGVPGIPGFPGIPGLDAGPLGACFACAQSSCGTQVNACFSSPACVQEGLCDVTTCLGGAGTTGGGAGGLGGLNLACFMTCGTDPTTTQELTSALTCVFGSCGTQCLGALTSLGGAGGGLTGLGGLPTAPPAH